MKKVQKSKPSSKTEEFTKSELDLLGTPEKRLKEKSEIFSFDRNTFENRITKGDILQQLLHGHIYLDHIVTKIIEEELTHPSELKIDRIAFSVKLELAVALGLIKSELSNTISKINSLRNKSVHKLDFEITDRDIVDLRNVTSKELIKIAKEEKK